MALADEVRRALAELPPGRENVTLQLRSGEALRGTYRGFDGKLARIECGGVVEEVEPEEVIDVYLSVESEGTE
jgi:hypothetical protein